jgi:hypothetical protein
MMVFNRPQMRMMDAGQARREAREPELPAAEPAGISVMQMPTTEELFPERMRDEG